MLDPCSCTLPCSSHRHWLSARKDCRPCVCLVMGEEILPLEWSTDIGYHSNYVWPSPQRQPFLLRAGSADILQGKPAGEDGALSPHDFPWFPWYWCTVQISWMYKDTSVPVSLCRCSAWGHGLGNVSQVTFPVGTSPCWAGLSMHNVTLPSSPSVCTSAMVTSRTPPSFPAPQEGEDIGFGGVTGHQNLLLLS